MNKVVFTKHVFIYSFEIQGISHLDPLCFPIGTEYSALVKLLPKSSSHQAVSFQKRKLTFSDNYLILSAEANREV